MHPPPRVIVYRNLLLPEGERFVFNMAEALRDFRPIYAGIKRAQGTSVALPPERTFLINDGGARGLFSEISFKYLRRAHGYAKRLAQISPALVHAQFGPDAVRALPLAESLRVPLVAHFRGYDATMKDEQLLRLSRVTRAYVRRRALLQREARLFIAVSDFIRRQLLRRGFPEEKILVHYTGVDTSLFHAREEIAREPLVLFVGRLVEKKGCEYLLRAMARVQAALPELRLIIIGAGPLRAELESSAAATLRHCCFLGQQPPAVVLEWMRRALVLALPSVTARSGDAEGMPNVAYEAQAVGLPVAAFAHAGIPEVVSHGQTGLLAREGDWEELATAIQTLAEDGALWQRLSAAGPVRVRRHFDLSLRTKVLEEAYRRVMSGVEDYEDLRPGLS